MTERDFKGAQVRLKEAYPKQLASSIFHRQKRFDFQ